MGDGISTTVISAVVSIVVSAAVTWFLGPSQVMRQDAARRRTKLRQRIRRILQKLEHQLLIEEGRRKLLDEGGQVSFRRLGEQENEKLLWPVVRALDDPDLGRRLASNLREGVRKLLGSQDLKYLSICEAEELPTRLQRLKTQPLEEHHLSETPLLKGLNATGDSQKLTEAIAQVRKLIKLIR